MEVFPAFCAGVAQTVVGHPFDTLKVMMQNNRTWRGMSARSFYRGAGPPLAGSVLFNVTVFTSYQWMHERWPNRWTSGAFAGAVVTPVVFLVDNAKVLLQTNQRLSVRRLATTKRLCSDRLPRSNRHVALFRKLRRRARPRAVSVHGRRPKRVGQLVGDVPPRRDSKPSSSTGH